MSRVTLRELTIADYESVHGLWTATEGMGLGSSDTREAIAVFLERNPGLSLVACDSAGAIVGAVLCGHDGRRGYLHHLAVAGSHRKQGLGRRLADACLANLAALGLEKCNITVFAANTEGQRFWIHNGWSTREDLVVIQRALTRHEGRR